MAPYSSPPTEAQLMAIAIAPKFISALSVLGSTAIVVEILTDRKEKLDKTYYRLVLGMSLFDMVSSSSWFFTTWPIPAGTPDTWGAVGTQTTCTTQGFVSQLSLTTIMYNLCLALYYLFIVKYQWGKEKIRQAEKWLHFFAISMGIATAVAAVPLNLYNNALFECWLGMYPLDCLQTWEGYGYTTCTRGDNACMWMFLLFYVPLWLVIVGISGIMYSVYRAVSEKEYMMRMFRLRYFAKAGDEMDGAPSKGMQAGKVAAQAFHYVGAFLATWTFPTILRLIQFTTGYSPYSLTLITAMITPVQGFFNYFIYKSVSKSHGEILL